MAISTVISLDAGTSSVKAGLFATDGELLAAASEANPASAARPGWWEQDPEATWQRATKVLRALRRARPDAMAAARAIAITGARGSFLVQGPDGLPRTAIITWQDRRAEAETAALVQATDAGGYRRLTGSHLDDTMALPKLRWLTRHRASALEDLGAFVLTPQGLVVARLGGRGSSTDWTTAAHLGVFDIHRLGYDADLTTALGIPIEQLPRPLAPGTVVGSVSAPSARRCGLPAEIPIVVAASDGVCAELGTGVIDPGAIYAYLGSGLALGAPVVGIPEHVPEGLLISPGSVAGRFRLLGLGLAGASVVDWSKGTLGGPVVSEIDALAGSSPAGARGVFFVPALAGAGAPFWSPNARGAMLGLSYSTDRADVTRAILEGVAFELRWMLEAMEPVIGRPDEVSLAGGGARSNAWAGIIADTLGIAVARTLEANPGLRGAACYALVALGVDPDVLAAARRMAVPRRRIAPDRSSILPRRAAVYWRIREVFREEGLDRTILTGELE